MAFGTDSKMTPEIIQMISENVRISKSSFKDRKENGAPFYKLLKEVRLQKKDKEASSSGRVERK